MSGNSPNAQLCCYCSQTHKPASCEVVVQVEARKQILKKSGCCFVCLKRGHLGRECQSSNKYRLCKGRHHSSICGNSSTSSGDYQTPPSQTANKITVPTAQNTSTTTPALDPRGSSIYLTINIYFTLCGLQ